MSSTSSTEAAFANPQDGRDMSFVDSRPDQIEKARAAVEKNQLNVPIPPSQDAGSFEMPAMLAAQLSTLDSLSGLEMQNNETVYQILSSILEGTPGYTNYVVSESFPSNFSDSFIFRSEQTDVTSAYGYAAMRAHRTYDAPTYLRMAQSAWVTANNYTITPQQEAAEEDIKNSTLKLAKQCRSVSLVGGTYATTDESSLFIDAISSGAFLVLSGLLANATGNDAYLHAATRSFQFMHDQLYSPITNSLVDGIDAGTCAPRATGTILDNAIFIEGTAILASVTKNETLRNLTETLTQAALSNVAWQNSRGVLTNDHTTGVGDLGHLMRALSTVYKLSSHNTALQNSIRTFVAVQYNALLKFADNSDVYAGTWSWTGPPQGYNYMNQSAAVDLLLAGLAIGNGTAVGSGVDGPPPPSPPGTPGSSGSSGFSKVKIGAIVGGVIGAVWLAVIIGLLLRSRHQRAVKKGLLLRDMENMAQYTPDPFQLPALPRRPVSIAATDLAPSTITSVLPSTNPPTSLGQASPTTDRDSQFNPIEPRSRKGGKRTRIRNRTIRSLIRELNQLMQEGGSARQDLEVEKLPAYSNLGYGISPSSRYYQTQS